MKLWFYSKTNGIIRLSIPWINSNSILLLEYHILYPATLGLLSQFQSWILYRLLASCLISSTIGCESLCYFAIKLLSCICRSIHTFLSQNILSHSRKWWDGKAERRWFVVWGVCCSGSTGSFHLIHRHGSLLSFYSSFAAWKTCRVLAQPCQTKIDNWCLLWGCLWSLVTGFHLHFK